MEFVVLGIVILVITIFVKDGGYKPKSLPPTRYRKSSKIKLDSDGVHDLD